MARRLRLQFPGAVYHVFNHGHSGQAVFATPRRASAFLEILGETCERLRWRVEAFALLPAGYHLVVETPEPNLVEGMRWLQGTFATRCTRSGDGRGPQFHGRYHSVLLEPGEAVAASVDYVHLLPVLRGVVLADHLGLFRWGSLRVLRRPLPPVWMQAGQRRDLDAYERGLQVLAVDPEACRRRGFDRIGRGLALGSPAWCQAREADHVRLSQDPRAPLRQRSEHDGEVWARTLAELLTAAGRTPEEARGTRKAAPWKVEIAARLRATTTATNAWIADRLHMGPPGAVSRYVGERRAEGRLAPGGPTTAGGN